MPPSDDGPIFAPQADCIAGYAEPTARHSSHHLTGQMRLMRWFSITAILLVAVLLTHAISPYVALYSLARAVETKDLSAIQERVDFHELRKSIARQIASAFVSAKKAGAETFSPNQLAVSAGTAIVDPLIEPYATPDGILALLSGRIPGAIFPREGTAASEIPVPALGDGGLLPSQISFDGLRQLFFASGVRGFTGFDVFLPPELPREERFGLVLRLSGTSNAFSWRLVGIELPFSVRERLAAEFAKRAPPG